MDPDNRQPAKLYRTAKTHKFNNINEGKKKNQNLVPLLIKRENIPIMRPKLFQSI